MYSGTAVCEREKCGTFGIWQRVLLLGLRVLHGGLVEVLHPLDEILVTLLLPDSWWHKQATWKHAPCGTQLSEHRKEVNLEERSQSARSAQGGI